MELPPDLEHRLRELLAAFMVESAKLNLTALRTEDACWNGNILDSLPLLDLINNGTIPKPASILDIGTGGGFPLLPLAVALPDTVCTGLDSIGKKIDAIRRVGTAIGLANLKLIADRAETIARSPAHRNAYHIVTSRAVAPLSILLEYAAPLAAVGGHIVLWKSMHVDAELAESEAAQKELHCPLIDKYSYTLGGDWGERQLLIFRKTEPTPKIYPREVGMAKKMPIGGAVKGQ